MLFASNLVVLALALTCTPSLHTVDAFSPLVPRHVPSFARRSTYTFVPSQSLSSRAKLPALSSADPTAENGNGEDESNEDVDFYDFLASKAASVNEPKSPSEGRQRRRDRVRKFIAEKMRSSGAGSDMVQPIQIDGQQDDSAGSAAGSDRVKPKFGSLFGNMPGLNDILAGDGGDMAGSGQEQPRSDGGNDVVPDLTDHPEDVARVDAAFFQFKTDVRAQVAAQRKKDPESVPPNAEEFLDRVIEEVREYDLKELREERANREFRLYEEQQMQRLEEELGADAARSSDDPVVREILEEAQGDEVSKLAEAEDLRSFKEYEKAMREMVEEAEVTAAGVTDVDVDERALRIMEELLAKRSEEPDEDDEDAPEWDTDNLEDGIAEIKTALEAKGKGVTKRPETMKEWQMYRSIATRIAEEEGLTEANEDYVASQLESWKEFQEKEEKMRRDAGLTKGARMPFPWVDRLEETSEEEEDTAETVKAPPYARHPDDIRADYDRKALQILSDLMSKTVDPARREKLMVEIEELKGHLAALEKKNWERGSIPVKEEPVEEELAGPIDVSDIFGQSTDVKDFPPISEDADESTSNVFPPPSTPFFSDSFEEDAAVDEELPAPPDTPFFSSSYDYDDDEEDKSDLSAETEGDDDGDVKSLGSLDEQKFRSMSRRAGVRSQAGEDELKRQWEAYLNAEKAMRDKTGLSGGEDPSLRNSKLDYDINDVVKEGGDIDADKVLASIGERPSKKTKKSDGGTVTGAVEGFSAKSEDEDKGYQQFLKYEKERMEQIRRDQENAGSTDVADKGAGTSAERPNEEQGGEDEDVIVYHKHATQWDKTSVTDQLYRSLSPEGRLRDDPEAKRKDKEAFEEYLRKEQEMRKAVEDMDVPEVDVTGKVSFANEEGTETEEFVNLDKVDDYVDDALDSIGPRPEVRKRKRADPDYARDYSDRIVPETMEDYEDEDDDDVPDWVKREREEEAERRKENGYQGEGIADDSYLDDSDYEKKQRQAEEFEQKYSSASTEISIGDVLGRDYFGPDDEPDDFYSFDRGRGSSFSSFEKRKKTLLEYTELSVAELDSLIEYKESESATGVSQYMKKVRKPYREFGAIFRLEGLLVDITGLQLEAWRAVAETHEFEPPTLEDVRLASAHRAAYAVQRIFYWTDDIVEVRAVAKTHHDALKEAFAKWMEEEGVTYTPPEGPKSFDLFGVSESSESATSPSESVVKGEVEAEQDTSAGSAASVPQPTESEYIGMQFNAWKMAAAKYGFSVPTVDEMQVAMYVGPEEAVTRTFKWTSDPTITRDAVSIYLDALRNATNNWAEQHGADAISALKKRENPSEPKHAPSPEEASRNALSKEDVMEMQLFAWTAAAEKHGFESPSLEDVQLASWVSTSEAVERVYKWAEDAESIEKIASTYREAMKKISDIYINKKNIQVSSAPKDSTPTEESAPAAPTQDDIMKLQLDAWTKTAAKHGCTAPNIDEVQLATFGSAEEAIRRVFKWAEEEEIVHGIAATHREVLTELSKLFMQRFSQSLGSGGALNVSKGDDAADLEEDIPFFELREGAVEWLKSLHDVEMPCAVVSHLDREEVDVILEQTGLAALFPPDKRVSATNFYGSQSQEFLGAALRLERRPDHCAVFDTTPSSSVAAHEVDMQSVCMIGIYKNYDLLSADLTVKYFDQLQTQNLRGLFSDTRLDEPQTEIQDVQPSTPKVQTKVRFWEEGDRE